VIFPTKASSNRVVRDWRVRFDAKTRPRCIAWDQAAESTNPALRHGVYKSSAPRGDPPRSQIRRISGDHLGACLGGCPGDLDAVLRRRRGGGTGSAAIPPHPAIPLALKGSMIIHRDPVPSSVGVSSVDAAPVRSDCPGRAPRMTLEDRPDTVQEEVIGHILGVDQAIPPHVVSSSRQLVIPIRPAVDVQSVHPAGFGLDLSRSCRPRLGAVRTGSTL